MRERLVSCEVVLNFKTKANMVLGNNMKKMDIDSNLALARKYIRRSNLSFDEFSIIEKVKNDISDKMNDEASELLKKFRKGRDIVYNNRGVWIQGDHIVGVYWEVAYPEFKPLTFEEYCRL